ncbi:MAG: hypothetical protein M3Y87_33950, partial [Myxococcota bacterium]|nr:hypothetical protein [Myxococcota bacterium]
GEEVAARVLPRAPETDVAWRYLDEFAISCRSGTRLGRRDFRGYQDPLLLHAYERVLAALREHPELAMQFNVRYALTGPHFLHGWDRHYLPPPAELLAMPGAIDRGEGVIELGPPLARVMPLAYFVPGPAIERVVLREDALARTIELAPAPIAILEDVREVAPIAPVAPGTLPLAAEVLEYESDSLALLIEAPVAGALVVEEAWYPGWRAFLVDRSGRTDEVPILRANGLVRAIEVPAGRHRVELRFEPPDGAPLRWLLLGSWIVVLALLIPWPARRGRDRREP